MARYEEKLAERAARRDPTAIPMQVDPTKQRMKGIAVHGNTPFDVPYISNIHENLWQGGCRDGLVLPTNIKHLVSLYPWESYTVNHELHSSLEVVMYDSLGQSLDQVDAIAEWVKVCVADAPTLVHCQAGLNRSSLVAGTALKKLGFSGEEAVEMLRSRRSPACLCNPTFAVAVRTR